MVLYRKYRPKLFSEVVGQEHVVKTLTNALSRNILSHGYLFCGPHGCGKTTLARLFAKSLNCQNRKQGDFEPCCTCDSCLEINQGNAIDLIEIDAASNTGVDDIRELKEGIGFAPAKSRYKVFILDEAHQFSKHAFNALLKTLEEPPEHAIFILATTETHKMIPTILSRCQKFDFHKLTLDEIVKRLGMILQQEGIEFEKEALEMIALSADGAQRDAETLLDQALSFAGDKRITKEEVQAILGIANKSDIFEFLEILAQQKVKEAIEFINSLYFNGADLKEFTKQVLEYLRLVMLLQIDPEIKAPLFLTLSKEEKPKLLNMAKEFSQDRAKKAIESLMAAETKLKYASIIQLPLELAIIDICLEHQ